MTLVMNFTYPHRQTLSGGGFSLKRYIYTSTMLGIFSGAIIIRAAFDIQIFDFIIISNLLLMSFVIDLSRVPTWIVCLCGYMFISGAIGIWNGTDSLGQVAKQFLGIGLSSLYMYYFFRLKKNDYLTLFANYATIAYWVCLIGFPIWVWSSIMSNSIDRLQSIASEPAHFCILVLPAYYWYCYLYFTQRKYGKRALVFTLAIALSSSSLGYLSVAFGIILFCSGRKKLLAALPIVAGGVIAVAYVASSAFHLRADDTLLALTANDVSGSNISTYALVSNLFVTEKVLMDSPLLGHGLGSHVISHGKYIGSVPGVEEFEDRGMSNFNSTDAASMTLRVLSELGIVGYLGILYFIVYFHVSGRGEHAAISNAILVAFFLKLIRGGLYFPPEQFFFVFVYILNHRDYKMQRYTKVFGLLPKDPVSKHAIIAAQ